MKYICEIYAAAGVRLWLEFSCVKPMSQRQTWGTRFLGATIVVALVGEDDGPGADLVGGADFGFGERGGELQADHLFVGVDGEGRDVGFGDRGLELLEEGLERDGVAGALIVGYAACALRDLLEIALAAEAAAAAAESCVGEVDGVDGDAGALRIGDGSGRRRGCPGW